MNPALPEMVPIYTDIAAPVHPELVEGELRNGFESKQGSHFGI